MSNFLAIATVTATLSQLLQSAVGADVPGATVTTLRPDSSEGGVQTPRVNLYLYQVTPNASWRNADLPTRRPDGTYLQRPQAALDLYYLLSFYGDEAQLEPQRLLGSVVRTLHTRPILNRFLIRETILNPSFSFLATSDLADDAELVLTPVLLNLEELSKLWSVFFQTPYVLSFSLRASLVLIESDVSPSRALPVRDRNIYIIPIYQPMIEKVQSSEGERQPITLDSTLVIEGKQLQGKETQVRIGEAVGSPPAVSDTKISIPLAAPALANALRAGIQGTQVIHPLLMGTPPVPHRGIESNVAAFVLRPKITNIDTPTITGQSTTDDLTRYSGAMALTVAPSVGRNQRVELLLNELQPLASSTPRPRAYRFKAPAQNGIPPESDRETTATIPITFTQVVEGTYLVRVQVDGAESLLLFGAHPDRTDPNQPQDELYIKPRVIINNNPQVILE